MNARPDDEARAALSSAEQDRLADLIAAFVACRAAATDFTDEELAELRCLHDRFRSVASP